MTRRRAPLERDESRWSLPVYLLPLIAILAILAFAAVFISSGGKPALPGDATSSKSPRFAGLAVHPVQPAPPIHLDNNLGQPITLSQYRGKVVLVTFLYTHCPDVCPLIAGNLHTTLAELGPQAGHVQLIAVSVDPHGDTAGAVAMFLKEHELSGQMQYLIGSPERLSRTWKAWNVGSNEEVNTPGLVAHSALVYGISASGKLTTIYNADFKPSQIVHDVPILESE